MKATWTELAAGSASARSWFLTAFAGVSKKRIQASQAVMTMMLPNVEDL